MGNEPPGREGGRREQEGLLRQIPAPTACSVLHTELQQQAKGSESAMEKD